MTETRTERTVVIDAAGKEAILNEIIRAQDNLIRTLTDVLRKFEGKVTYTGGRDV